LCLQSAGLSGRISADTDFADAELNETVRETPAAAFLI
jgi:hypothetical protein